VDPGVDSSVDSKFLATDDGSDTYDTDCDNQRRFSVTLMTQTEPPSEDRLVNDLRGAVDRGEIVPFYQPQIEVDTGRVVGIESLARWFHPELGLQSPLVFIPIAEEFGIIDELGKFMIDDACAFATELAARRIAIDIAVNVSALQLAAPRFFNALEECIDEAKLRPGALTLEITESRFIANRPVVSDRLQRLRDRGVSVSIDDFGVGHSSVEQVLALPANELKIDRTIVQDEGATNGALMATIVTLVKDRGLRTVAEGVETAAQLERVRQLGCDRAQGYYIAEPMSRSDLEPLLVAAQR
jgi:EAL domain-containing protein (putative c-di-GMP-specific phosphodiesterase class I)